MRGIVFRVSIAILTFSVGLAASQILFRKQISSTLTVETLEPPPVRLAAKTKPKYQVRVMAKTSRDGYGASQTGFFSSDGRGFSLQTTFYDSDERASRELRSALSHTEKIIRSEQVKVAGGRLLEITIATFPVKSRYGRAAVLWADGSMFRYIQSTSLENILTFEKDFQGNSCLPLCEDLAEAAE